MRLALAALCAVALHTALFVWMAGAPRASVKGALTPEPTLFAVVARAGPAPAPAAAPVVRAARPRSAPERTAYADPVAAPVSMTAPVAPVAPPAAKTMAPAPSAPSAPSAPTGPTTSVGAGESGQGGHGGAGGAGATPSGAAASGLDAARLDAAYREALRRITAHRRYPELARRREVEGAVTVVFRVAATGAPLDVHVAGAADADLDEAAVDAVRDAQPLPVELAAAGPLSVRLEFRLDR